MLTLPSSTTAELETGSQSGLQRVDTTYPNTDPMAVQAVFHGGLGDGTQSGPIVYEAAAVGTAVGQVSLQAANDGGFGTLAGYSLSQGDAATFSIDSSGVIHTAAALDYFHGPYTFAVTATDTSGRTLTQVAAVAVNEADHAPGATTGTLSVAAGAPVGTIVGTLHAADREADATAAGLTTITDRITYRLVDDDGGTFAINANTGVVTLARTPSGTQASISVSATDLYGASHVTDAIAVAVTGTAPAQTPAPTPAPVVHDVYGHASKSGTQVAVAFGGSAGGGGTLSYVTGDPTAVVNGKAVSAGTLTFAKDASGASTFTLHPSDAIKALPPGTDPLVTFSYHAVGADGTASATATARIQMHDAPKAPDLHVSTFTATPYVLDVSDLVPIIEGKANDEGLHIVKVGAPSDGTVALDDAGEAVFTPNAVRTTAGGGGQGAFFYKVADMFGNVTTGKVTLDLVADKVLLGAGDASAVGTANVDKFVVSGGTHAITMVGGADVAAFHGRSFGMTTVDGFAAADAGHGATYVPHNDIEFSTSTFSGRTDTARLADLLAHATDTGSGVVVALDAADSVTLHGVHRSQLTLADVHFLG